MTITPWRTPVATVRGWALFAGSRALAAWVSAVVLLAAALAVLGVPQPHPRWGELAICVVLVACGAVCVEAVRRVGEPAGVAKDLLSAWTLPVALLLPPWWSLLVPVVLTVLTQVRVRRGLLHRRAYSAAAIGLGNWVVSVLFHRYESWGPHVPGGLQGHNAALVLAALGCAVVGSAVNVLLIGKAVRLAAPEVTWREQLVDREQRLLDAGELCLGVAVAGCWAFSPVLAVTMLVPVLLVQRSLTHNQLRAAARLDAKTGLLNSQAWQAEAEREIVRAQREGQPLAVLISDLDNFRRVNDTHGHLGGDVALLAAVAALTGGLRTYDQLGRFGGEEFTAVLPRTGHAEAARIAERLRQAVADAHVVLDGTVVPISLSVGVAVLGEHGSDLTDLLTAADHALYRAKGAGRNQVAIAL